MTNIDVGVCEIDKLRIFIIDEQHRPRSQSWYFKSKGNGIYIGSEKTGRALKLRPCFFMDGGSSHRLKKQGNLFHASWVNPP